MTLQEAVSRIRPLDKKAMQCASLRWNSIAKPLHSLGKLEEYVIQIAGMTASSNLNLEKKALVIMCADNGVVEEGVTQTGQEVTAIVAENFLEQHATASIISSVVGADIFPVDIGIARDTKLRNLKIAYGTKNMAKEPAMTREEAVKALETGITMAEELFEKGYGIIATGEMGIGNTTTSSAIVSVLLEKEPQAVTGRGAGLSGEGLKRKIQVIEDAVSLHQPDKKDAVDVLSKVGGFDIAGMAGVCIGCAALGIPVVIDGFISAAAGLVAVSICPGAKEYMLASHMSKEPAMSLVMEALGLEPPLHCGMSLGEGTGAVSLYPLLDIAVNVYEKMSTFQDVDIETYKELV